MSTVFGSRLMGKWWLMLVLGLVIGLLVGLVIGRVLPADLFGGTPIIGP